MSGADESGLAASYVTASGLTVRRIQPAIGAEITGVDLCQAIPAAVAADIRRALLDHGVIFFRDQPITYENHVALAEVFGEAKVEGYLPDRPELMVLRSDAANTNPAGGHWHSDGTYFDVAPAVSILHAVAAAPLGGDTCFSSAAAAYAGLPDTVKARIAPLRARASMSHIRKVKGFVDEIADEVVKAANVAPPAAHPVVRVHPDTGQPVLYVNECHTMDIVGMDEDEGTDLLRYLTDEIKRPEYQMRWAWTDHAIAIWDNRAVQHYAVQNEAGPRHVERIMVLGTPSIGVSDRWETEVPAQAGAASAATASLRV